MHLSSAEYHPNFKQYVNMNSIFDMPMQLVSGCVSPMVIVDRSGLNVGISVIVIVGQCGVSVGIKCYRLCVV